MTSPLTTTGAYVTVLRRAHNRWAVAYRVGSVIVHHPLANGSEADAVAEAERLFPEVPVWMPGSGESVPRTLKTVS